MDITQEYSKEVKEQIYKAFDHHLSPTTKSKYALVLSNWISYTKSSLHDLIYNMRESIETLKAEESIKHTPSNHHIHLSAVVAFIKYVIRDPTLETQWKEEEKENWQPIAERYDRNEPSELQKDKMMPFEDIQEVRENLPSGSFERLLLSFYTLIEPIRADYFCTELIENNDESKEENYINLTTKKMYIRDFKTKNKYTQIENVLSDELVNELETSLKRFPRRYLFVTEDRTSPFQTRKLFSNWACRTATRVLKHPMTLTALRHIYITEKMREGTTPEKMIEIAKRMGHSRAMQRVYEWS